VTDPAAVPKLKPKSIESESLLLSILRGDDAAQFDRLARRVGRR
jgi:hypothetical protein